MMNLWFFPANHSNSCGAFATAATLQIVLCLPEHRPRFRQLEADGLLQLPFPPVGQLQLVGGGPQGGLRAAQLHQGRVILTSESLQVSLQHRKLKVMPYFQGSSLQTFLRFWPRIVIPRSNCHNTKTIGDFCMAFYLNDLTAETLTHSALHQFFNVPLRTYSTYSPALSHDRYQYRQLLRNKPERLRFCLHSCVQKPCATVTGTTIICLLVLSENLPYRTNRCKPRHDNIAVPYKARCSTVPGTSKTRPIGQTGQLQKYSSLLRTTTLSLPSTGSSLQLRWYLWWGSKLFPPPDAWSIRHSRLFSPRESKSGNTDSKYI